MTLRTIEVVTADGQRHVFEYDTEIEGVDHSALDTEVRAALVESTMYTLATRSDGTTATFMTPLDEIKFFGAS